MLYLAISKQTVSVFTILRTRFLETPGIELYVTSNNMRLPKEKQMYGNTCIYSKAPGLVVRHSDNKSILVKGPATLANLAHF